MPGYAMVTFAYAGAHQYKAALVVDAVRWTGPEVLPEVEAWAVQSLVLLTSPKATLQCEPSGRRVLVSNGRDKGLVLDCSEAGV